MAYGYYDCDWPVGNDMAWLPQPQYPISPHEYDIPNAWAELIVMRDNCFSGNGSNILDINNLSSNGDELFPDTDASSSYYSDSTFSPIPGVNEDISSPMTDISSFELVTFDHTYNFDEICTEIQHIFVPSQPLSLKLNYCSDPAESKIASRSSSDATLHRREHAQVLLDSFLGPDRCPWKGCTSRAKFANPKFLNIHLINIHVEPLICGVSGCGYQKPFRNKHDLERHKRTAHMNIKEFACPYTSCSDKGLGFARKDKLLVHFREVHGGVGGEMCPIPHCGGILSGDGRAKEEGKESMAEHMKKDHGSFECALGRCGKYEQHKTKSLFSDQGLERHLKREHEINCSEALRIVGITRKVKDKTVREPIVGDGCTWRNCKTCGD